MTLSSPLDSKPSISHARSVHRTRFKDYDKNYSGEVKCFPFYVSNRT